MLILAIDTSAVASAALISDDAMEGVVDSFATEDTRSHAEVLAPGIEKLLTGAGVTGADIDAIVTGVGPGPFTGLRSGIATARTLAFVWNKPLYGLMSLDAIALEVAESTAAVPGFLVATDARRKEVYWARYSLKEGQLPDLVDGPHVGFASELPDLPVFGAGAGLYADVLRADEDFASTQPDAASLGQFALARLASGRPLLDSTPLYLRESDAQVPGPRKRAL
ncbi:tRNA (adenosine(37)-N6)-threonylcarbamoyltransferase complex dimerization subunit type 1 TsaB [Arthrobacter sp. StoSoilB3]|jgi:tRNA threonylcarbamoyl adenosine modification protein YeaZ|uniref:tRNA (adenosine(37)-N6)-threonylcarbamoyltransferase complex dimerization subunit type 1 TsaB n=1 Tax=Paenarthrobacter TaxID=1742992 RepID=UPI0003644984|nr:MULTISPECIES: tRNA (adenosine(37)-N6)-threonylcarbamoyltransferase complex dimerization subunit type 1 TsaB [Paenarthrobacter]KIA72258.1 glycoprotease family protein [Arthrobacter sp. MWB30]KQR06230.1 tRNA threonylcarbamoyladenosine biosynthesis protein TsaB [Arthrobacter sp. Leaf145]SKB34914.1 tRNA threonylcarbamoyl adenosine modification protein YeaZ [Arthrobacter sp. 31Cvi3.1E]BCW11552.1 tRNA (adenosine(37)-N6)-threonylcarbamoyltransferase complex dimerization subunit type 1 TsaB [Arthrob